MNNARHSLGFTLLEALVTLVIVSLMVALLMQALSQVLNLRERVLRHQMEARVAALQERWFRDSVQAVIVDLPDALGEMQGTAESMRFVTANPLASEGLGLVRWDVVPSGAGQGLALVYTDLAGRRMRAIEGPLRSARFDYRAEGGEWQSEWRPEAGQGQVLPRLVRLQATGSRGSFTWIVALSVEPAPASKLLRPEDPASGI